MKTALNDKLQKVVELVDNIMVDPDIDLEYCIPEVSTTSENCDVNADPYITVKYSEDTYVTRKIRLTEKYLDNTPKEIANLVTFSVEQFKEEVDALYMGA